MPVENSKETTELTDEESLMEDSEQREGSEASEKDQYCSIHPDTCAFKKCPVCGKYFCVRCLVHYYGTYYCETCGAEHTKDKPGGKQHGLPVRTSAIPTDAAPLPEHYNESPKARRALSLALVGLIPGLGIVLDVMALIVAFGAFAELSEIRGMKGTGKAVIAMLIALVWLAVQMAAVMLLLQYLLIM